MYHKDTFEYTTVLSGEGRDDSTQVVSAQEGQTTQYNVIPLSTNAVEIQIGRKYDELDLTITSNNAYPATFVSLEWHPEAGSTKG